MHVGALVVGLLAALLLGGCGQVITRVTPTPPPSPTVAPPGVTSAPTLRPTSTPAPYTPAPTATPTVTPTPVIYRVQSGDSLLAIAQRFGISVQALQDANGIADPRNLQIGQELMVPQNEGAAEGTPTPGTTPTALPFVIENLSFSRTAMGGLWCFGEIHNTTGNDLEQAAVVVSLLDEQGAMLTQQQAPAGLDLIPPDGKAPFALRFQEPPVGFASYTAYPVTGVRGYVGSYYRDLVVRDTAGEGERYSAYMVTGKVTNVGPEDAVDVRVTVTLYDALGRVIGMRQGIPEHNVVLRGGESSFSIELTPAGGPVAHFRVEALGRRLPTPTAPPSQAMSTPQPAGTG